MSKAFITLLWIASALLTYWLGLEQGSENSYSELEDKQVNFTPPAVSQKKKIEQQVRSDSSSATLSSEPSSRDVLQSDTVRDEEIIVEIQSSDLQERIKSSNPIVRLRAFTELLEDGSSQSIEQAKEIYEKLPEGPQRFSELRMLAYSWGQSDPQAALEWSKKLGGFDQRIGTGSVLDSWSRYDSAGAIAWAKENFEGEDNPYYIGIISGMSENDLIGASELMATLPYGRTRGRAASILVEKAWQMGEEAAINFADNLPKAQFRIMLTGRLQRKLPRMTLAVQSNGLRRWTNRK